MYWRFITSQNGDVRGFAWIEKTQKWLLYETANTDNCDQYALCGPNGFCNIIQSFPDWVVCGCFNGFVPVDWVFDRSYGCVRKTPLNCSGDGFRKLAGVKMPETKSTWFSNTMNLRECKNKCLEKCNCTAYSNLDIRNGGSGCMLWFGDLIDIRVLSENKQEIYIRMAGSELDDGDILKVRTKSNVKRRIVVSTVLSTAILFLGLALVLYVWKRKQQKNGALLRNPHKDDDLGLPLFDLEGRPKELLSESIIEACNLSQALRSIHVALLCVQENREDRPDMSYVVLMFGNEDALPRPKHPGFYIERDTIEESLPKQTKPLSENECSISLLEASSEATYHDRSMNSLSEFQRLDRFLEGNMFGSPVDCGLEAGAEKVELRLDLENE
ncbi:hypothetical protein DKX38_025871 [Salix brachista]|uniref:Apple domain-containing protein n=1 Tax=Salix brachista TaxID=2182728 RepID=A0A5N5JQZ2_9ROSI|nr:hypothetical protein DKX38_025871 [Salix brachista]